jgi:acyl-CoA thioesterase FadM
VPDPIVWAALDCPAGIAWNYRLQDAPPLVTGRMTVRIDAPVPVGESLMVIGWPIEAEGRKLHAGTALVDARGRVLARSRQLWMIPRA